jgi:hypothetical protein
MEEKPYHEYLPVEFGKDSFSAGILMVYFDLVVMLKIFFIPTIEFTYSTASPLLIISSPMPWKRPLFGCCPVPGEPQELRVILN